MSDEDFLLTGEQEESLKEALLEIYYPSHDFLDTPQGQKDLTDHITHRYYDCLRYVIPWVSRYFDLQGKHMVEIGCGSGSSAVAFARHAAQVDGYEIIQKNVLTARRRAAILQCSNVRFHLVKPELSTQAMRENHPDGIDVALIYAVLEHMTIPERLDTLTNVWSLIRPGGYLIVGDTPNRLVYQHEHTSGLPFFDMLPEPLMLEYTQRAPNKNFRTRMAAKIAESPEAAIDALNRWGRGISFHEFELAMGDLSGLVVGDGYDPVMAHRKRIKLVEKLLLRFLIETNSRIPYGYSRKSLDLIFRKPLPGEPNRLPEIDYNQFLEPVTPSAQSSAAGLASEPTASG